MMPGSLDNNDLSFFPDEKRGLSHGIMAKKPWPARKDFPILSPTLP